MRYSENLCPRYQHAVEIVSKRWTPLIVQVLLDRPMRFNEIAEQLEVVSDRVLSERLKELETEGIVTRRVFPESPVRVEYALTEKGQALSPILEELARWSQRWIELSAVMANAELEAVGGD